VDSDFIAKEPCPKCGSRDNLARYSDGHGYCFGCHHYERGEGQASSPSPSNHRRPVDLVPVGTPEALPKRALTLETLEKWGCGLTNLRYDTAAKSYVHDENGKRTLVFNYRNTTGQVVAQKLRFPGKDFSFVGDAKGAGLFGAHLWRDKGSKVVVTEGEIDAMSVSQVQDHRWPVVSIPKGAPNARRSLAENLEWLGKFDEVILMFDGDEPGQNAAKECLTLFRPGQCKIAKLPLKDANEMLKASRSREIIDAIFGAKVMRPDGVVTPRDLRDRILTPPPEGFPWFSSRLTALTYGRRPGELYGWGAGSGAGKTDIFAEQIAYDLFELSLPTGVFSFEQNPAETVKRIASKRASKCFHVNDGSWEQEQLVRTLDELEESGKFFLYDSWGSSDWDVVRDTIRFLALSEGVKVFYIDNLTALVAQEEDEQGALKRIMSEMAGLANSLGVIINYVSHLATPEGKPHEEGGHVSQKHFRGSRVIAFWTNFMFGIERNQVAEDLDERRTATVRVIKDRNTGRASGECVFLKYDPDTGRYSELAGNPFEDEAPTAGNINEESPF
jgi:twinkle protein